MVADPCIVMVWSLQHDRREKEEGDLPTEGGLIKL